MLSTFWMWFVMPVFKGVPAISIAAACGISLLMATLTHQKNEVEEGQGFFKSLLEGLVKNTLYLGIGWAITWFM